MSAAGSFDAHNPPDPELLADCVHCGFCLPTCPTYQLWGEEMDSPRGRIHLMNLAAEGDILIDESFAGHFDACLGCMACVTACPSGVQYDRLLESVRPQVERAVDRSHLDRAFRALVFGLFPRPTRLRMAAVGAWIYQRSGLRALLGRSGILRRLPARLQALEALMPDIRFRHIVTRHPRMVPASGTRRRSVALLEGCVQRVFFAGVNEATARVLAAEGCEIVVPKQGCCGALSVHAGREEEGLDHARRLIDSFEDADVDDIVVNVAGCGSTLKEYGELLASDAMYADRARRFSEKVKDVSEVLADLEPAAPRHPLDVRIAYHDACHLAHGQGVREEPRRILRSIPGLDLVDIPEASLCCGSAGTYNLMHPEAAEELGRRKAANVLATQPDAVTTGNPGCLLQISRYLDGRPVLHPVEILDASIRGVNPFDG